MSPAEVFPTKLGPAEAEAAGWRRIWDPGPEEQEAAPAAGEIAKRKSNYLNGGGTVGWKPQLLHFLTFSHRILGKCQKNHWASEITHAAA